MHLFEVIVANIFELFDELKALEDENQRIQAKERKSEKDSEISSNEFFLKESPSFINDPEVSSHYAEAPTNEENADRPSRYSSHR
jgi:hypothetical protein